MVTHMDYTKATDNQLKNIIEQDIGVPAHLLKGVYEEAMNRNLFRPKIVHLIIQRFGSAEKTERSTGLAVEDLLWICYERGYELIGRYELNKPFSSLWNTVMINEILLAAQKHNALKRTANVYSLEDTHEWAIPGGNHTEPIALARIQIEHLMSQLTETEKEIVIKRYQGYSLREIGKMQGISLGGVYKRIMLYKKRLKGA